MDVFDIMGDYIAGPDILKLPAVLYYKKGDKKHGISKGDKKHGITATKHKKHTSKRSDKVLDKRDNIDGGRRDVVFLSRPADYAPTKPQSNQTPTTSYTLFDYQSNYRNWQFLYPEQHPVHMQYVDQGKAADPNQQNGAQQQTAGSQAAPAAGAGSAAAAPAAGAPADASPAQPTAAPNPALAAGSLTPEAQVSAQLVAPLVRPVMSSAAADQSAKPAVTAVAAPAVAPAANPAAPQVGQAAAAAVQQPAAPVAAQQPVAAQPQAAANQTIQLLNQTVSLATNNTFEPTVANASQTNQTALVGAMNAENSTNVAPGNVSFDRNVFTFLCILLNDWQILKIKLLRFSNNSSKK